MSDVSIEMDAFGRTVEQILERLGNNVRVGIPPTVDESLEVGQKAWKRNARRVLSTSYSRGGWGKARANAARYRGGYHKGQVKSGWYGTVYKTGAYARSINHQILTKAGEFTEGEIGSRSLPGLAHLLEKGHGYFPAAPHVHIEPAADEAFEDFERRLDDVVERAINDT